MTAGRRLFEEQMLAIKHEGLSVTQRETLRLCSQCLWQFIVCSMWEVVLSAHRAAVKAEKSLRLMGPDEYDAQIERGHYRNQTV